MSFDVSTTKALGRLTNRLDGPGKVTGGARYTGDFILPGMLHGHCLRSPFPNARIISIDATRAMLLPGVHAVLTGLDVPDIRYGRTCKDVPILCRDRVRFIGDKVAAVAAESSEIAEEAMHLIEVKYEELPAVFDPLQAMSPTSPLVHAEPAQVSPGAASRLHGDLRMYPSIPNVISRLIVRKGDVEAGFARSRRIFEHHFSIPSVHQGYIEPHSVLVSIGEDQIVDIWVSNKGPHVLRPVVAEITGAPQETLRFNPVFIGGDFGGKGSLMDTAVCYFLAKRASRPVKMIMSYAEELTAGNPRHSASITLRTGVSKEAEILAMDAKMIFNSGAYAGFNPIATVHGYAAFAGPYRVPNCAIESLRVYTNTVPAGHMRSPGGPQVTFAVESHLDMIAREMGLDPVAFRLRNAICDGDSSPIGETRHHMRCKEVIEAGASAFNWNAPRPPGVGRGVAVYENPPGAWGRSTVALTASPDGRMTLLVGCPETGTGFHSAMRNLVAEHFRVSPEEIDVVQGDTLSTGFEHGASGSRLTVTAGEAVQAAAGEMKGLLASLAAERLNCAPDDLDLGEDGVYSAFGQSIGLKPLMEWAGSHGKAPITCVGENAPEHAAHLTQFAAQFAEVEVYACTGQVRVRHVVTSHDVGTIVNPITHQGQIEGGVIQGLGQAMSEEFIVRDGVVATAHLGEYKLPTIMDIPKLTTVLVPAPGYGAFDLKAIGEMANVALPAAIANAVYDAVGVRLQDLSINAEKVFWALQQKRKGVGP